MTGSRLTFDQPGTEASTANPFPVTVAGSATAAVIGAPTPGSATLIGASDGANLRALRADAAGRLEVTGAATGVPHQSDPGVPVRVVGQETFVCSFAESGASVLSTDFGTPIVGTGVTYNQASGALNIVTGTNTNAEFLTRTAANWREAIRLRVSLVASQRIVNQNLAVILGDLFGEALAITINSATSITVTKTAHGLTAQNVGQSMMIGGIVGAAGVPGRYAIASVPTANTVNFTVAGWPASGSCTATVFGWNCVRLLTTGTTATNVAFDTMRRGWFAGDTTATTNTTAAPGTVLQVDMDGRNVYLSDTLRASSATLNVTSRASRLENIPDVGTDLYLFVWSYNGSTAPASTTTWTISYVAVENMAAFPVIVAQQRAQGTQAAAPVAVVGTAAVSLAANTPTLAAGTALAGDFSAQYRAGSTGAATIRHVVSAASTNATSVKASAGKVVGWQLQNTTAAIVYVKLHNTASAPTAGTGVVQTIGIPANGKSEVSYLGGIGFATGIGMTIVTGAADADATAVALNAVVGDIFFA